MDRGYAGVRWPIRATVRLLDPARRLTALTANSEALIHQGKTHLHRVVMPFSTVSFCTKNKPTPIMQVISFETVVARDVETGELERLPIAGLRRSRRCHRPTDFGRRHFGLSWSKIANVPSTVKVTPSKPNSSASRSIAIGCSTFEGSQSSTQRLGMSARQARGMRLSRM
jgi:hypothetical protein